MARNSQVINAMGMIPEGVLIWGRETAASAFNPFLFFGTNSIPSRFVCGGVQANVKGP